MSVHERKALKMVALGHTSAEIAGQLGLSAKTVENYRHAEWKSSVCEREPYWRGLQCKKD